MYAEDRDAGDDDGGGESGFGGARHGGVLRRRLEYQLLRVPVLCGVKKRQQVSITLVRVSHPPYTVYHGEQGRNTN